MLTRIFHRIESTAPKARWKRELQHLANDTGLAITLCHYPSGASNSSPIDEAYVQTLGLDHRFARSVESASRIMRQHHVGAAPRREERAIAAGRRSHQLGAWTNR